MLRVVVFTFSFDSTNGLGNAPSPPPWVTLKTSEPPAEITSAVDFGIVAGNGKGNLVSEFGSKVTKKLVPSVGCPLNGSESIIFLSCGIVRTKTATSYPSVLSKFLFNLLFEFLRVFGLRFENNVAALPEK